MVNLIWIVCSWLFAVVSFFPAIGTTHWVFRLFDFLRIQITVVLGLLMLAAPLLFGEFTKLEWGTIAALTIALVHQLAIILPYFPLKSKERNPSEDDIVAISVNVKQDNQRYDRLIEIVKDIRPHVLLTMETDGAWQKNLAEIEHHYPNVIRVPMDNRYGMHLYTSMEIKEFDVHYLISGEHPSIEAKLVDTSGNTLVFWGVHPPPPSPTEKPTSRQKDAELLKIAKMVRKEKLPVIVAGDFNNATWSRTSRLFSKISDLTDARKFRGVHSTFPANVKIMRFPIDLLFHSQAVTVTKIKTLESVGSDHLPLLFSFHINERKEEQTRLRKELQTLAEEKIAEGKIAAKEEN